VASENRYNAGVRPRYLLALLLVSACNFDLGFDGTQYQCGEGGRCPPGQSCVAGVCVAEDDAGTDAPDDNDASDASDRPDGPDPAPVCGNLSLLRDTFDQAGDGPLWIPFNDTGASVSETGGELVINLPAGMDAYAGYISAHFYDLHGGGIEVQVAEVGGDNTIVEVRNHLGNTAQLVLEGNMIAASLFNVTGAGTLAQRVWNPAERFWRIREEGGDMVWELSTDRASWSELHRRALPFAVEHVRGTVSGGGLAPATSRVRFEDVNLNGSAIGFCSADLLVDDFAATPFGPIWDNYQDAECTLAEQGGDLVMTYQGNTNNSFCGLTSNKMWDLSNGGGIVIDGAPFPSQNNFVSYVQANQPGNGATRVEFTVDGNDFEARSFINDVSQGGRTVAVNDTTHKFWRLSGTGSTAIFETSPDGGAWTELHRLNVTWDLSASEFNIGAGNYGTTTPVTIRIEGINAP
jgi:hypothetical protein